MSTQLQPPVAPDPRHAEAFSDRCVLTVDAASDGLWYVSSGDQRVGGVFKSRKAALHFAHDEGVALPQAVVVTHEGDLTIREEFLDHTRVAATVQRASA